MCHSTLIICVTVIASQLLRQSCCVAVLASPLFRHSCCITVVASQLWCTCGRGDWDSERLRHDPLGSYFEKQETNFLPSMSSSFLLVKLSQVQPLTSFPVWHRRRGDDGQRGGRSSGHPPLVGQDSSGQNFGQENGSATRQGQEEASRRNPGRTQWSG